MTTDNTIKVGILDSMIHDTIIGDDALLLGRATIDYATRDFHWLGQKWQVRKNNNLTPTRYLVSIVNSN
jgi:hypothetical protein